MNLKTKLKLTAFTAAILLASGCSSSHHNAGDVYEEKRIAREEAKIDNMNEIVDSIPQWFLDGEISDENGFYAVSQGAGGTLNSAITKAELRAKTKLAATVSELISAQSDLFEKSTSENDGEVLKTTINSFIAEQNVAGVSFDRFEVKVIGDKFVAFKRAYYPTKELKRLQREANFAKDLDLSSELGKAEMMNRIEKAKLKELNAIKIAYANAQTQERIAQIEADTAKLNNQQIVPVKPTKIEAAQAISKELSSL